MSDNVSIQQANATMVKTVWLSPVALLEACADGDLSKVKDLIARGADPHFGKLELALLESCRYMVLVFMCTVHYLLVIPTIPYAYVSALRSYYFSA